MPGSSASSYHLHQRFASPLVLATIFHLLTAGTAISGTHSLRALRIVHEIQHTLSGSPVLKRVADDITALARWDVGRNRGLSMVTEGSNSRVKGGVLIFRLNMLRLHGGQVRVDEVLRRLPPEDQAVLRKMILPIAWYSLELQLRLDAAIADVVSPEDRCRAFIDMGRASAEEALHGAQHVFVRPGDPQFLLSQAPQIFRLYNAVGSRTYERTGNTSAVLRTFDAENVTETDCIIIIGWHERAIELSGGRFVTTSHPLCRARGARHCEYHFAWE